MTQDEQNRHAQGQAAAAEPADEQMGVDNGETAADGAELTGDAALIAQLQGELAAAQAKADEYLDRMQRTAAEFQNSRRRLENQLSEEVERANSSLIKRLLPVLDDLDLAFQNVPAELDEGNNGSGATAWIQGFRQIRKKLLDLLIEQGITPVETTGIFDPVRHEAISSEPSDSVESGHIIGEVRAGYEYKGRVLRPALVRVAM